MSVRRFTPRLLGQLGPSYGVSLKVAGPQGVRVFGRTGRAGHDIEPGTCGGKRPHVTTAPGRRFLIGVGEKTPRLAKAKLVRGGALHLFELDPEKSSACVVMLQEEGLEMRRYPHAGTGRCGGHSRRTRNCQ